MIDKIIPKKATILQVQFLLEKATNDITRLKKPNKTPTKPKQDVQILMILKIIENIANILLVDVSLFILCLKPFFFINILH